MSKYERMVNVWDEAGKPILHRMDVYDVLVAFRVTCPATAHAVKKMLCAGQRGHKDRATDLREAIDALERAITLA